ncbi:hypothetical protein Tco_1374350, partial [Tanacetum coccineum]
MTYQAMLDFIACKTYYAIALRVEPLKSKKPKTKSDSTISSEETPSKKKPTKAKKDVPSKKKPASNPKPLRRRHRDGNDDDDDNDSDDDDNDGNDDDDDSDQERTESDRDEIPNLNQFNEEQQEEEEKNVDELSDKEDDKENEEESDDGEKLYKDVNVNLRKEYVEMTDVDKGEVNQHNVSHECGFEQEEEDAHVTLTTVHDTKKTVGPMQSSSVSSDFTEKLLNFENVSPADNEIASLMDTWKRISDKRMKNQAKTDKPSTKWKSIKKTKSKSKKSKSKSTLTNST